jgi:hypothetical protein
VRRGALQTEGIPLPADTAAADSLTERLAVESNAAYSKSSDVRKAIAALEEEAGKSRTAAKLLGTQAQRLADRIPDLAEATSVQLLEELSAWDPSGRRKL